MPQTTATGAKHKPALAPRPKHSKLIPPEKPPPPKLLGSKPALKTCPTTDSEVVVNASTNTSEGSRRRLEETNANQIHTNTKTVATVLKRWPHSNTSTSDAPTTGSSSEIPSKIGGVKKWPPASTNNPRDSQPSSSREDMAYKPLNQEHVRPLAKRWPPVQTQPVVEVACEHRNVANSHSPVPTTNRLALPTNQSTESSTPPIKQLHSLALDGETRYPSDDPEVKRSSYDSENPRKPKFPLVAGTSISDNPETKRSGVDSQCLSIPKPTITATSSIYTVRAIKDVIGCNPEDLSFKRGQSIVVSARISSGWLQGTVDGKSGVFPVDSVEHVANLDPVDMLNSTIVHEVNSPSTPPVLSPRSAAVEQEKERLRLLRASSSPPDTTYLIATCDFVAQGPNQLSFLEGNVIVQNQVINSDWLSGSLKGITGMFPKSCVRVCSRPPPPPPPPPKSKLPGQSGAPSSPTCHENQENIQNATQATVQASSRNQVNRSSVQHKVQGLKPPDSETLPHTVLALYDFDGPEPGDLPFKAGDRIAILGKIDRSWYKGKLRDRIGIVPAVYVVRQDFETYSSSQHQYGTTVL